MLMFVLAGKSVRANQGPVFVIYIYKGSILGSYQVRWKLYPREMPNDQQNPHWLTAVWICLPASAHADIHLEKSETVLSLFQRSEAE